MGREPTVPDSATASIPLGVPGISIEPGDHLCALYRGPKERDELLFPYLREGLQGPEKVMCVVDASEPDQMLTALAGEVDIAQAVSGQRLEVLHSRDTFLRGSRFRTGEMMGFWEQALDAMVDAGYPFARNAVEMSWSLRDFPRVDDWAIYECEVNRLPPRFVALCLYDLDRFGGAVVMDVLRTHPKVLVGGMLVVNPYYIEPDAFLARMQ